MRTFLLLLLPALIFAQWETSTPFPSEGECEAEIDKIHECAPDDGFFKKLENFELFNKTEISSLIDQLDTVLDCFGDLKCKSSRLIEAFIKTREFILTQLYGELETCLIDNGLLSQLEQTCEKPTTVLEGPPPVNPDSEECDMGYYISCSMKELRKHPEDCSREQRNLFYKVLKAMRASCLIYEELERTDEDEVLRK